MELTAKLLEANKAWVAERLKTDENYFNTLAKGQSPDYLWIGCSDSRVPANEITGTRSGEIFVHRNVANLVVHTDINMLSVLQYAVEVLKVKHVLVVGHYQCGGVNASMTNKGLGLIDKWLLNIKEVYAKNAEELDAIEDERHRSDRLVELNVQQQVKNLAKTTIIQEAWSKGQKVHLHGWVYGLHDGILKQVFTIESENEIEQIFRYDFSKA